MKVAAYKRSGGFCERCTAPLYPGKFRYDHDNPDGLTGEPTLENCVVACLACDSIKTPQDISNIARAKRRERNHAGIRRPRTITAWRNFRGRIVRMPRER